MPNEKTELTDEQYINVLELREEEYRRSIRVLSSLLSSSMDTIAELQMTRSKKKPHEPIAPKVTAANDSGKPFLMNTTDVAELLGISKATALKFVKAIGGIQVDSRWMISNAKIEEFISNGEHVDLS